MVTLVLIAVVLYFAGYGAFYLVLVYYDQKHEEKRRQEWLASPKKWHD